MVEKIVEVTRLVEVTPEASQAPVEEDEYDVEQAWDRRPLDPILEQDRGGVIIRVKRVSFAYVSDLARNSDAAWAIDAFIDDDVIVLGSFTIEVENTTEKLVSVYPALGTVLIANEQSKDRLLLLRGRRRRGQSGRSADGRGRL